MRRKTNCTITDTNDEFFEFTLWNLNLVVEDEAQHAEMIAHPNKPEFLE
jgi:hypothetical protein